METMQSQVGVSLTRQSQLLSVLPLLDTSRLAGFAA